MKKSLSQYQAEFNKGSRIHMNNAGLAPISKTAAEKVKYWAQRFYEDGFYSDHDYMSDIRHSRQSLAQLLGAEAANIAFFQSTAGAVSQIAFAFGLQAGDEVVLWRQEYSSNLYPWQQACVRAKAQLVTVESEKNSATPYQKIIEACTPKTKIVAVSWVQFETGAMTDIEALVKACHQRGIFVFVDVMQGLGLYEFRFKDWGVDAVGGGSHKWLTSPVGVGFLALKAEHFSRFQPLITGSATYGTCDDPANFACVPKSDASKFEAGSKQVLEITALGASCDLLHAVGTAEVRTETLRLARRLRQGLEKQGFEIHSPWTTAEHGSAIVNFSKPGSEEEKAASFKKMRELLSAHPVNFAMRGPGLRLSPHAFNTDQEIDVVLNLLRSL